MHHVWLQERCSSPLRSAILACRACRSLATRKQHIDVHAREELLEKGDMYENCALRLLDAIPTEAQAFELLTTLPTRKVHNQHGGALTVWCTGTHTVHCPRRESILRSGGALLIWRNVCGAGGEYLEL